MTYPAILVDLLKSGKRTKAQKNIASEFSSVYESGLRPAIIFSRAGASTTKTDSGDVKLHVTDNSFMELGIGEGDTISIPKQVSFKKEKICAKVTECDEEFFKKIDPQRTWQMSLPLFCDANGQNLKAIFVDCGHNNDRILSLFSGAGGLDIGFEKAGFKTVWANEYDKTIAPSYQRYFPDTLFDGRSIRDVPDEDLPGAITGVIGGPPCQSWSEAGARRGIDDTRGQLFFEYLRVIKSTRPKFFVAENVHGLIHSRNLNSFENIIKLFSDAGYEVSWKLLRASDYGVPQDRERVFIVGYDKSLQKKFVFPEPTTVDKKVTLRDAIGDLAHLLIGNTHKVKNHELIESGYSPIFMSRNRVRSWDEQAFTILATERHIPFHPQAPKMIPGENGKKALVPGKEHLYRRLTVRECARIQTFPDDYEFIYTNIRNAYKMIGNAVPVNLAYHVAHAIKKDLEALP